MNFARRRFVQGALLCGAASSSSVWAQSTSPDSTATGRTADDIWFDTTRQRSIPVRVRWPRQASRTARGNVPVVIFSHGLGGTLAGGERWGQAWSDAGLIAIHLQHPGSDLDAVRAVARHFGDRDGLRRAMGPEQLIARLGDVSFVLDELARRSREVTSPWRVIDVQAVGLSGHSFGAHTTLGMAGQRYPGHPGVIEPRLAAFIAFSPTLPPVGDPVMAFDRLTRPMLSITGTRDDDVVGVGATPDRRIGVFAALPPGQKAHLVLDDADHMTFAGQTGRAVEIVPRSPAARALQSQHHDVIAAVTTDWWRLHLLGESQAQSRLMRPAGLAAGDLWQTG